MPKIVTLSLIISLLFTPAMAGQLPANTWVKTPATEKFVQLTAFSKMISNRRRPRGTNWLFINKWFNYSSTPQGAWIPESRQVLFVNGYNNTTWLYDPIKGGDSLRKLARKEKPSGWQDMKPGGDKYRGALRWSSLCYDPLNKEVLLFGGNCAQPGGSTGTMIYNLAKNEWKRLDFSRLSLAAAHTECDKLRRSARELEGRLRSRWHLGETSAEAKEDLGKPAAKLLAGLKKFLASLPGSANNKNSPCGWARSDLSAAVTVLGAIRGTAKPEEIAAAARAAEHLCAARDALAPEPPARAYSQLAWDAKHKKIVLFGGDHLDYLMSDTWIYDPGTRQWTQRRPGISPAPRGGHALVYLPKSGKLAMLGGYAYRSEEGYGGMGYTGREPELWVYDIGTNKWEMLKRWGWGKDKRGRISSRAGLEGGGPVSPRNAALQIVVSQDDVILSGDWVCRVDSAAFDATGRSKYGVKPGTITRRTAKFAPCWWDQGEQGNAAASEKFLQSIPVNTWTKITPPKTLGRNRDWGTATFDTDRGQIIYFSGGHCAYSGTDVHVYSTRANRWRTSSYADFPVGFCAGTGYHAQQWSFNGRPFMTSHTYKLYAYDPASKKMLLYNRDDTFVFDPLKCEWELQTIKNTPFGWGWIPKFCTMPDGLLVWSNAGKHNRKDPNRLWRFDHTKRAWQAIKTSGDKLPKTPSDDYGTLVYDSKRKRALMFVTSRSPKGPWSCDLVGGVVKNLKAHNPKAGPDQPREAIYLPPADMVLFAQTSGKSAIVYDCAKNKFRLLEIANPLGKKPHGYGLMYDPKRQLVWTVSCGFNWPIQVMRFDAKTARFTDAR
jgi:Galactose oxidase, central domain